MPNEMHFTETMVAAMVAEAIAKERERCAKVADEWAADGDWDVVCCRGIAAQIRDHESAEPQLGDMIYREFMKSES